MSANSILERTTAIAGRVVASEGMELVEVEWKGGGNHRVLRLFIDKPGGVTLDDCENVSHQVGAILDVEDFIPTHYTLEVSSPGLDRKLLKASDFQRFLGKKAQVNLRMPLEGRRHFVGRLAEFDEGSVGLDIDGGRRVRFPLEEVQSARLVVEI